MEESKTTSLLNGLQSAVTGAALDDLVKVMHTNHNVDISLYEDEFKGQIQFMEMIWTDAIQGGNLFENFYTNVSREQVIEAGRPGTHSEILAVNELIKELKSTGKFTSLEETLGQIKLFTKGQTDSGEFSLGLCVHCFYLLPGVKLIGR